jgi:hypothetical protein
MRTANLSGLDFGAFKIRAGTEKTPTRAGYRPDRSIAAARAAIGLHGRSPAGRVRDVSERMAP